MDIHLLRTINIFEELEDEELEQIFKLAKNKLYPAGTLILEEGKDGGALYVIVRGSVRVTKKMEGQKDKVITTLGSQSIFGEMSFFDNLPFSANVTTLEETSCMLIPKAAWDELLAHDLKLSHKLLTRIITVLTQRVRNTNEELVALTAWKDRLQKEMKKGK